MRPNATEPVHWTAADARGWLTPPADSDDKYSRGVLGFATGSIAYPGAAIIGVDAALHTGVGMVRYLGPEPVGSLVLQRRPEAVLGDGRVHAWVVGSGMTGEEPEALGRVGSALAIGAPAVVDAGAIGAELVGPTIITPHAGELAKLLGIERSEVSADPAASARQAAKAHGAVVLIKGATTFVTDGFRVVSVAEATPWLATAGAGDALAGVLGALIAARAARGPVSADDLLALGATAAFVHGRAARLAAAGPRSRYAVDEAGRPAGGGPFTILELNAGIPDVVRGLLG